jgi:hypothetical protein
MKIMTKDLKKIIDLLFEHLIEVRKIDEVEIELPYYWHIPFDNLQNMELNVTDEIGSYQDDWDSLSENLLTEQEPSLLVYDLVKVSSLLRYIGEEVSKEVAKHGG